jgi:outer membrane protein assembly factor BamB
MSNRIWAFDLNTGAAIWKTPASLGPPFLPMPGDPVDSRGINKSFGILSTPVIDADAGVLYVVYWLSDEPTHQSRALKVSAIRLSDGKPVPGKPALPIQASAKNTAGEQVSLSQVQKQRAALLLVPLTGKPSAGAHKMLYVAFTGAESPPAGGDPNRANHGWVVSFDVDDWKAGPAWLATPNSFGGGIWQGGQGPAADEDGNVYLFTGNGGYITQPMKKDFNGITDFAECFVKLSYRAGKGGASLALADWFIPFRDMKRKVWKASEVAPFPRGYDYTDQDLGSAGPILPPGMNLILGAGKDGVLYVLDRNNMSRAVGDFTKLKTPPSFFTFDPDRSVQAYRNARPEGDLDFKPMLGVKTFHLHGSPVYWRSDKHGPMLFVWGENNALRAFSLDASGRTDLLARGTDIASAKLADPALASLGGMPGGMITLSANKGDDGIVWGCAPLDDDANLAPVPGVVRAYDVASFTPNPGGIRHLRKLWEAKGFTHSKFCPPVVADGRLIVPTYDRRVDVYVYGDVASPAPKP